MATANTEAAAVKAARAAKPKTAVKPDPTGNVTGKTHAPAIGVNEPPRNYYMLGDPDEPRAVIEAAGGNYGPILGDDYVVAPEEATETFVPFRCKDSITRVRWCAGQHVPREVFFAHYGEEKAAELLAAAQAAREPVAEIEPPKPESEANPENPPA